MENLWEVTNFDDLIKLLRTGSYKFIILAITLKDTKSILKKKIKKLVKTKANNYPKLLFLYYQANSNDLGKVEPILADVKRDYPKLYYIYNTQEIWASLLGIDPKIDLEEFFNDIHQHYIKGCPIKNEESNEPHQKEPPETNNSELKPPNQKDLPIETNNPMNSLPHPQQPMQNLRKDPLLEKQRYDEKIELLKQIQTKCKENFIKDCRRRKENEEKINSL